MHTSATMDNRTKPSFYDLEGSSYQKMSQDDSVSGKLKNNPLLVFALTGFSSIVTYKLYRIRQDRKAGIQQRLSLQLINVRLIAQGFVIGSLSLSVFYMLGKRAYNHFLGTPAIESSKDKRN